MKTFYLVDKSQDSENRIADGCILPDGQAAIARRGEYKTHGCYPTFEAFESIQTKMPNREIIFEINLNTFALVRDEDETGISGTGTVAKGCVFPDIVVLQWTTATASTFWYPSLEIIEAVHGHNGKTKIVMDGSEK